MGEKFQSVSPMHVQDKIVQIEDKSITPSRSSQINYTSNPKSDNEPADLEDISDLVAANETGGFLSSLAQMKANKPEKEKQIAESQKMSANVKNEMIKEEASYQSEDDDSYDSESSRSLAGKSSSSRKRLDSNASKTKTNL